MTRPLAGSAGVAVRSGLAALTRRPRSGGRNSAAATRRPQLGGPGPTASVRRPQVHQFTAVLADRDAVGAHTLALHRLLAEDLGCDAEIFAAQRVGATRRLARDFRDHPEWPRPDLVIYQASVGSPVADYLLTRPEPLVVYYHGVTPAEHFDGWDPAMASAAGWGRVQLGRLGPLAGLGLAGSGFAASELAGSGVGEVVVAPPLFDAAGVWAVDTGVVSVLRAGLGSGAGPVWLFVGRVVPNKGFHDLLAAFAVFRGLWGEGPRLVLAGSDAGGSYGVALRALAEDLGLGDSVVWAGSVSGSVLAGWYSAADVFVCLSDHEGFGVPLVEAMGAGLPVVAFDAGAVAGTLGGAGVLLGDKSPAAVAAAVGRVLEDGVLRDRLTAAGRHRAAQLHPYRSAVTYADALEPLLNPRSR